MRKWLPEWWGKWGWYWVGLILFSGITALGIWMMFTAE